ncbi:MAG: mechanosensitive ion channel family protein [Patescibacteria group bacterium]|nr:mechanosensitive ion channel family protein [Patescibacteria group bacterium]
MLEKIIESELLQKEYFGNIIADYISFLVLFFVLLVTFFLLKQFILRKIENKVKGQKMIFFLIDSFDKISIYFYFFVSFYISSFSLNVPEFFSDGLYFIFLGWTFYYLVAIFGSKFINLSFDIYIQKKKKKKDDSMIRIIKRISKVVLWLIAILVVISSMGINITAFVAGMGVGGIAIAFALQQILGDLFSSFSIYFDKPFTEGDYVVVDDKGGVVEKIGIKSTRIRALQGEEMIFANKELTSKRVHNFGTMKVRRGDIKIGIVYSTPAKKMEKIPKIIEKVIKKEKDLATFSRAHFSSFGDFSLNYEIVYLVNSSDYSVYMDVKQKILLNIKKEFEKEEIHFAYPTNTIYFSKQ